ncbi:MAG: hypothetical protein WDM81_07755 [Rhizomicrobium sp.]
MRHARQFLRPHPRQPQSDEANQAVAQTIKAKLGTAYTIRNTDVVGPQVSAELFHAGILATLLAVLAIALWVAFRFEWQYGVSAALATGHDVLVTAACSRSCTWTSR